MSATNGDNLDCLVGRLRTRFGLSESVCSNSELLRATDGTFGRARVEMSIAVDDLRNAIHAALPTWLRWIVPTNDQADPQKKKRSMSGFFVAVRRFCWALDMAAVLEDAACKMQSG